MTGISRILLFYVNEGIFLNNHNQNLNNNIYFIQWTLTPFLPLPTPFLKSSLLKLPPLSKMFRQPSLLNVISFI